MTPGSSGRHGELTRLPIRDQGSSRPSWPGCAQGAVYGTFGRSWRQTVRLRTLLVMAQTRWTAASTSRLHSWVSDAIEYSSGTPSATAAGWHYIPPSW
jgi:hypothetical protein